MIPLLSVIVPIYNVDPYLGQCLESILNQELRDIEVICIDDGSTDGSGAIVDAFAKLDERVIVVHKANGGYGKGVNRGLAEACGEYIGIVEPDDYVDPSMYRKLIEAAQANTALPDVVKGAYWRVCESATPAEHILPANYLHRVQCVGKPFVLADDAEFLFHHPSIWSAIYRRNFLTERNIAMREIPGAGWADNPFLMETLLAAESIVYVDEPLYYYREFATGSSSNVKDPSIIYDRWLDMDAIVREHGVESPRILEGHYNRGCAYIEMLDDGFDTADPKIAAGIAAMVGRIDYDTVLASKNIPPNYKDAYLRHVPEAKRTA